MFGIQPLDRKVRTFSLSPSFLDKFAGKQPNWGFNGLGYLVYKRTYSRLKSDGTTEEWIDTCQRVVEGVYNLQKIHCKSMGLPWNEPKAQKSAQEMFTRMWDFKWLPPGRGLWMMGTDQVLEKGVASLMNCSFVSTKDIDTDFTYPFTYLMDMSMLGVGVGGDVRGAGKVNLVVPRMRGHVHTVSDSREGWVEGLKAVILPFTGVDALPSVVDVSNVRRYGAAIKNFGGVASGPEPLVDLYEAAVRLLLPKGVTLIATRLYDREGDPSYLTGIRFELCGEPVQAKNPITGTQIADLFNMIGACVVAGNVRRSAEILFGEATDKEFRSLKDPTELNRLYARKADLEPSGPSKELDEVNAAIAAHPLVTHRWCSNNSVFGRKGMDYSEIVDGILANGEPGIFWIENAQNFGRMADPPDTKDAQVLGCNPCSEIPLFSGEMCNLTETFPIHCTSKEDFLQTLKFAYLYNKTVTLIPCHDPRSNAVILRNRRIGCSLSGIVQAIAKLGQSEFDSWCDEGFKYICKLDKIYSSWLCVPESIRHTTVKPSGTVSLLAGVTPGVHYPHSEFYIRRMRIADNSPLLPAIRKAGYPIEKDVYSRDTSVVSFPVRESHFTKGKAEVSVWEQFAITAKMQRYWSDNMVSVTATFKPEERSDVVRCLEMFEDQLKSVSLLPLTGHGYAQAPYESITEEQYLEMAGRIGVLDFSGGDMHDAATEEKFCSNDVCEIKR